MQDDHTLEITSIFALLVVRSICHAALPTTCYIMPPILPCQASNHLFPSGARICIVYHISHIMSCFASCCLCIASWLIVVPLLVFLFWVEPGDEYAYEEPVEYAYEDQSFDNSENIAGKLTIPSKSLLSLLC